MPANYPDSFYIYDGVKESLKDTSDVNGNLNVTLNTSLNKDIDSIDVAKQTKGPVTTLTFAGSGDSAEINCVGYKSVILQVVGSATVYIKGTMSLGGTKYNCYNGATQMSQAVTTGACVHFTGIPDYISVNANAACTVYVQPLN